jgi:GlcNAc-P-P-Und epimerase
MSTVVVTGGNGFLGKVIVDYLLKSQFTVVNISRKSSDDPAVKQVMADLRSTEPDLSGITPEKVIHIAGKAHIFPKTAEEAQDFFDVNVKGTQHLLSAVNPASLRQFILISTVAVYGLDAGELITEDQPLQPVTPYGKSKLECEQIVTKWCAEHNVPLLILRLPLVAGANPPGNLGDMKKGIQSGRYASVAHNKARKSVVVTEDIARLTADISNKSGIFNLTDGLHPLFSDIEHAIEMRTGKSVRLHIPGWILKSAALIGDLLTYLLRRDMPISTTRLNKIISTLTFSDQKARNELSWKPQSALDFIRHHL